MKGIFIKKLMSGAAVFLAAVTLGGCAGNVNTANYGTTTAATFNGEDIYMSEAMYYLRTEQYSTEMLYSAFGYNMEGFWESAYDANTLNSPTYGDLIKDNAIASVYQTRVLKYNQNAYGVTLTDADEQKIAAAVDEYLESTDENLLQAMGATREGLLEIYTNNAIANKVWAAIVSDVDTAVDEEEVRQTAISYFTFKEEDSEDAKTLAEEAYDLLTNTSQKMIEVARNMDITAANLTIDKDTDTEISRFALELSEDEAGLLYSEDASAYYVIYCVAENDEEATQAKIESIIEARRVELFNERYPAMQAASPSIKVKRVWNSLTIKGTLYVAPVDEDNLWSPYDDLEDEDLDADDLDEVGSEEE